MELKFVPQLFGSFRFRLLIAPYGIEINEDDVVDILIGLLIAPYGIEIA